MTRAGSGKGNVTLTARFLHKTRLCAYYERGYCARGDRCGFAHGSGDVRTCPDFSYTQPCRSFIKTGKCKQGDACTFAHAPATMVPWKRREAEHGPPRAGEKTVEYNEDDSQCDSPERAQECEPPRAVGKMLPLKCREAEYSEHHPRYYSQERAQECDPSMAVQCERQQHAEHQVPWALDGRPASALPAPRPREVLALRGQESPSQLKATVKRTFLHFFMAGEEDTIDSCRRCSSAPPVVRTD